MEVYSFLKNIGNTLLNERGLGRLGALRTGCCCGRCPMYGNIFYRLGWRAIFVSRKREKCFI